MQTYDVAIIGAGAGGLNAAFSAVQMGKKVILIDKYKPGGECTWSGCIPSKALIQIAKDVKTAKKFVDIEVDTAAVMAKVRHLIEMAHQGESTEVLEDVGIAYLQGDAKFLHSTTIDVDGQSISASKIIISTGSRAAVPPIEGLDKINYLTNENVFSQKKLPKSVIVLGGGAIGVELSQAMQRLGVQVTIVEMSDTILPREEPDMAQKLQSIMQEEGVHVYTSSKAVKVKKSEAGVTLVAEQNGEWNEMEGEALLLALGRQPNTAGLNLDNIGVKYHKKGIEVNEYYETSIPNIYAVGDVVGPYLFSHTGGLQGRTAIQNAFSSAKAAVNDNHVAWCTFTDPEFARSGMTEVEAREKNEDIQVYTMNYQDLDRAVVDEKTTGMAKIICNREGLILGASILGERACELLGEIQVLKAQDIPFYKLQEAIHPYPGYSELLHIMSIEAYNR